MLIAAFAVGGLSLAMRAGDAGIDAGWLRVFGLVTLGTLVLGLPFVRFGIAAPSSRLPHAQQADRALPHADAGRWRVWGAIIVLVVTIGALTTLVFLVAVLGEGGTAEGVVVGLLAAWGLATLADAHQIAVVERGQRRRYYAAVDRPTAVGRHVVWENSAR